MEKQKKEQFFNRVKSEAEKISKKERKVFREFCRLNGRLDLTQKESVKITKQVDRFVKDKDLINKYYIYHLDETAKNKWLNFPLEETVFNYYKQADRLQEIYFEVFGRGEK